MFNFFKKQPKTPDYNAQPPIGGGDGSTKEQVIVLNCASIGMAQMLINRIISEKFGKKGIDWKGGIEMFAPGANGPDSYIRILTFSLKNGIRERFYFDLTRSMKVVDKLRGAM